MACREPLASRPRTKLDGHLGRDQSEAQIDGTARVKSTAGSIPDVNSIVITTGVRAKPCSPVHPASMGRFYFGRSSPTALLVQPSVNLINRRDRTMLSRRASPRRLANG